MRRQVAIPSAELKRGWLSGLAAKPTTIIMVEDARTGDDEVGLADSFDPCERRPMEEETDDDAGGSCDEGQRGGGQGGGARGGYSRSRSLDTHGTSQGPLPMATTPPLSPEHLEAGEARRKAEFSRSNTWDRIAAAGLYAISLWKLSQEMIEEKAKGLTDVPVGKQKVH